MITEHTVCGLPEDNVNWRHYAIKVQRRGSTGRWLICWPGYYLDSSGEWSPSMGDADEFSEDQALRIAGDLALTLEVNGITVAEALR